jgi:hypothetical protein
MNALLAQTRAAFGSAPRAFTTWDTFEPPTWMTADDPLRASYGRIRSLLTEGDIVWGHAVQANALLFRPGSVNSPASVLFGSCADVDLGLESLRRAALTAWRYKGTAPVDERLAPVAEGLTREMQRHPLLDLPDAITAGMPMRMLGIMIHRNQLPGRVLSAMALPLVVDTARTEAMVLPLRYWADDLRRGWAYLGAAG